MKIKIVENFSIKDIFCELSLSIILIFVIGIPFKAIKIIFINTTIKIILIILMTYLITGLSLYLDSKKDAVFTFSIFPLGWASIYDYRYFIKNLFSMDIRRIFLHYLYKLIYIRK